jgi:hypothetical protein
VTYQLDTTCFSVENLKSVTHKRNTFDINLKMTKIIFPDHSAHMESVETSFKDCFSNLIEDFAISFQNDKTYYFRNSYERYLSSIIGEEIPNLHRNGCKYEKHFKIVNINKLAVKMYAEDIIYVYPCDSKMLVCTDADSARELRKVRR